MKMRNMLSYLIITWLFVSCQNNPDAAKTNVATGAAAERADTPADNNVTNAALETDISLASNSSGVSESKQSVFQMKPDTIEVRGKFSADCDLPASIRIAEHNELNAPWKQVPVNAKGEFSYKVYLTEPRRIAMRTEKKANYDFFATTKEKVYVVEIACYNKIEKLELKNSAENLAYHPFSLANKKFRNELDEIAKEDVSKPEVFQKLKNAANEYQKAISDIAQKHPNTFTATVLCAADKLPEGSLNSLESLRKNFLQRDAFGDPYIYNDFLGQRIILNYLSFYDPNTDHTEIINRVMNIGARNKDAATRLQQICYNIFYNRHKEELLMSYVKWAQANPGNMHNQSVQRQLSKLSKVLKGNQYTDIQLKDPAGAPRKLSDVVNAAKLTLLVFYSPTCSHCQQEIPQLKPIWDQYKSKGLKIYIVGFDATDDEWKAFIKTKANAEWTHVFEYAGYHPTDMYVVNYTPTYILIDSKGKILTRMAEFEDVKRDIPKLMN